MSEPQTCAHCGRICGDSAGGSGHVDGATVCRPNEDDRPDCYHLITAYGQPLGALFPYAGVPLRLTAEGPGSRASMIEYVQTVIEQRTTPNDDTDAGRLARGIVTSILSRLDAGYSVASGERQPAQNP